MTPEALQKKSRKGIPNLSLDLRCRIAELACQPDISVSRLALEHVLNANLVFRWRWALRAGEYDPIGLLPVTLAAPAQEVRQPAPAPVAHVIPAVAIEIGVGNARVRIEGSPDEATLLLVLRMLCGPSESVA
ncbi:transposase [Burkholderia guangdongensis]|uniref:transposase n=1 Tax=Burkholderia guangdongensis TaxID=1792500 RepID=UPI0015CA4A62|nr:transposase [Burkholderia guangdongensis]